jgi:hypothetical protein
MVLTLSGTNERIALDAQAREPSGHFTPIATALRDFILVRDTLDVVLPLPATWSHRDIRNVGILAGLLRDHEVSMPLRTMVCHQISTAEEARTYLDYLETGHGAMLDFELVGWSLPIGETQIRVDPLFVAFSRARITNAAEVSAALAAGEQIVPVDLAPAPAPPCSAAEPPSQNLITYRDLFIGAVVCDEHTGDLNQRHVDDEALRVSSGDDDAERAAVLHGDQALEAVGAAMPESETGVHIAQIVDVYRQPFAEGGVGTVQQFRGERVVSGNDLVVDPDGVLVGGQDGASEKQPVVQHEVGRRLIVADVLGDADHVVDDAAYAGGVLYEPLESEVAVQFRGVSRCRQRVREERWRG